MSDENNGNLITNGNGRIEISKVMDVLIKVLMPIIILVGGFLFGTVNGMSQDIEVIKSNRFTARDGYEMQRVIQENIDVRLDRIERCLGKISNGRQCEEF